MLETGFVTHSEYQKHIRGDWRTVHDLWRHIQNYMTDYAQPGGGFAPGSIAYAGADGFLTENNAQLYWDAAQHFLGVGVGAPECRTHIRGAVCADYSGIQADTILLLENDDNVILQFQCATTGEARICFADDNFNPPAGRILYNFATDYMDFTIGMDVLVKFEKSGADSRIISSHRGIKIDSPSYAAFIADSHNADAYVEFQEDTELKWTVGFDYDDGLKFQISQGMPGTNTYFEIEVGLINLYLDVGIRNSQDLRFYDNGNYVGFKAVGLGADQIWILPTADGNPNDFLQTDGGGNLGWAAGGAGAATFVALTDTPANYAGSAGKVVVVNATPDALEFVDALTLASITLGNEGLHLLDTGADHDLIIKPGSDLSVDRILTITTGDAARTITLSGNPTLADWFDQAVKQASSPSFAGMYLKNSGELRFYDNGNYVGFEAPALGADQIWVLPSVDGDAGDLLQTDGAGNLAWTAAGGATDEKVKVDAAAAAGYLGIAGNDGVLRVDATLNYADGGDFVTLGVDSSAIKLDDLGTPDDNTDLDFSTAKHGLVPKGTDVGDYLKDDGTWNTPAGAAGPVLIFDSGFDDLALGNIDGKGVYSLWGTWVNGSGADCTAEIVADPGNGRMLRLDDQSAVNACFASLTMTPNISAEVLMGIVEWKVRVSALAANSRGYLNIQDKDIAGTEQGGYFKGDTSDLNYRSSGNQVGKLTDAVVDTWYIVRTFFDRLGNYCVWWLDGAFEQNRIVMNAGDKFDKLVLSTRDIYSGNVFDIKYVKVWSLHYV